MINLCKGIGGVMVLGRDVEYKPLSQAEGNWLNIRKSSVVLYGMKKDRIVISINNLSVEVIGMSAGGIELRGKDGTEDRSSLVWFAICNLCQLLNYYGNDLLRIEYTKRVKDNLPEAIYVCIFV